MATANVVPVLVDYVSDTESVWQDFVWQIPTGGQGCKVILRDASQLQSLPAIAFTFVSGPVHG